MKKFLLLGAALSVLFLTTGCGDGWESKIYDGFPYGNGRTAGHGIEYVRAKLMPEKGPVLDTSSPLYDIYKAPETSLKEVPLVEVPSTNAEGEGSVDRLINSGEKFFRNMQRK